MPWSKGPMDKRVEMIQRWESGKFSNRELAEWAGVSEQCVGKWIRRYKAEGAEGLPERSRRPHHSPNRTDPEVVERLLELKRANPQRGPEKLVVMMSDRDGKAPLAASTAGEYLSRYGLVQPRKRQRSKIDGGSPPWMEMAGPGHTMSADYKGQFRLLNGRYCYPLTISDPVSRFIYAIEGHQRISLEQSRTVFERIFRSYGLPFQIVTDNGTPFCCPVALGGLTALSKYWIKLGIHHVRIEPGKPQQNGCHERMHRTLKAEATIPPQSSFKRQQEQFEAFRYEFNNLRPHEALGQVPPASVARVAWRNYPQREPEIEYPSYFEVRNVRSNGQIKWAGEKLFVSEVLIGEPLGLEPVDDGIWHIHFGTVVIGRLDERSKSRKIAPLRTAKKRTRQDD